MTPEAIALEALRLQQFQVWLTALAIFLGPLAGVLFTVWFQSRKERRDAKHRLFLTLLAERKLWGSVSADTTKALNSIDVVFADRPEVKSLWHTYYNLLAQPPGEERGHKWIELLGAMAKDLGYTGLSQVDLDKFYIPQGHVDDITFQRELAKQWKRVLDNTERFVVVPRADHSTTPIVIESHRTPDP